jgi:hypoxanthine phosphoribosyltransferase
LQINNEKEQEEKGNKISSDNIKANRAYEGTIQIFYSWTEMEYLIKILSRKINYSAKEYDCILAITNGGIIPARLLARDLNIELIQFIPVRHKAIIKSEMPHLITSKKYLVVDDIFDSGNTYRKVLRATDRFTCDFAFCICRYKTNYDITVSKILNHHKWVVFPWEKRNL